MPLSLFLYVYQSLQEKICKRFEKNNEILSQRDIDRLLEDRDISRTVEIFRSAVVDHKPVGDVPYYLRAPVEPLFYHDNFKRCVIADTLGDWAGRLDARGQADALAILDELSGPASAGYVQIFARHALGRWALADGSVYRERKNSLLAAFGGTTASLLAALVFIDHLESTPQGKEAAGLLTEGRERISYRAQKVLFSYYAAGRGLGSLTFKDKSIVTFLENFRRAGAGKNYFEEGARSIGFIPSGQKGGLADGTQQADIGRRLKRICGPYLCALGLFMEECW